MATYYVAHKYGGDPQNLERAQKITHDLQVNDLENCYICPLMAFSHMSYNEIGFDEEMELCKDLLTLCDGLIIASDISKGVQIELDFAKTVGMEVEYYEP